MNIKSLLLGSAAALVAVSGARAADAVVIAEPEPMEYVRVCDTYGVGFYYIPGTETCLKVSGYLRYDIGVGFSGFLDVFDKQEIAEGLVDVDTNDTYYKRARFALRVDSRAETELGTLRTYAQINFNYDVEEFDGITYTDDADQLAIEHAYIELGGFRVGVTDSLFSTFTGYSSGVSNDGLVPYGPFQTHQIAYTFTGGNGFTAAIAVEEGGDGEGNYDLFSYALDDYVPHVVGGVGWTGGWGGVSVVAGYDAVYEEGAVKGRVDFNVNDALSLFVMGAWASNDDTIVFNPDGSIADISDAQNYYAPWGGEWAVWGGGAWKVTEQATVNLELGYDDFENFSAVANVDYELVNNFHVIPEIIYVDNFGDDDDFDDDDEDNWGGFLRLQANFGG
jgi:hypothetical protein